MVKLVQIKKFIITLVVFTLISFSFSTIGLGFEDHPQSRIIGNPLEVSGISIQHVLGHIFWGMIAGLLSLRLNYVFLCGGFALLLDADHLLQFLDLEMISRMGHSVPFAHHSPRCGRSHGPRLHPRPQCRSPGPRHDDVFAPA